MNHGYVNDDAGEYTDSADESDGSAARVADISLGGMLPQSAYTASTTYNATKHRNVVVDSADRSLFYEPLLSFRVQFGDKRGEHDGCSVPTRLRDVTKLRCSQCVFPITNEVFTSKYYQDAKIEAQTYQRLLLSINLSRYDVTASNDVLGNPYHILVPDSAGYFVKFIPLDTAADSWDTPINVASLQLTVEPSAFRHDALVRHDRPLSFPTLDIYPFSAIVYDRLASTLSVTFTTPLDERFIQTGFFLSFERIKFIDPTEYERQLQLYIREARHFMVVSVTKKGFESDTFTLKKFDSSQDGYIHKKITGVLLHFEFDPAAPGVGADQYAFDLDTRNTLDNVVLNRAFQYQLLLDIEYRTKTLVSEEADAMARANHAT